MVQLNTTYDSSIHQKIFVLKGDEGYARTTDTIATLITDFGNYTTYISKCHVGLEIQVLRELGDSFLHIYCDDEELYSIPWSDSGMAQIIDEDWNDKGVYWENGKLIIGKYDYENNINTGLFLLYDVEHTIKVRYDSNEKCLGSSAKPIVFTVPSPDTFATELSFNKVTPPRYAPNTTINDITVTLTSDNELTSSKLIDIYDDSTTPSTLLTQVELEQDVASTITLTGLSDGVHKIRASWTGDGECYATDSELDISVGYKITNLEYPSYLISGTSGTLSCIVTDYFDNPWSSLGGVVGEEGAWEPISQSSSTDSHGFISFDTVYFSNYPFFVQISGWSGEKHTTNIINPTSIQVAFNEPITDRYQSSSGWMDASNRITATVMGANNQPIQVAGIDLSIYMESFFNTDHWWGVTDSNGRYTEELGQNIAGVITGRVTVKGTQISNSAKWIVPEYWWSSSKNKQVGSYLSDGGITVSKVSNGFRLDSYNSALNLVKFAYDSPVSENPVYRIEFDVVRLGDYNNGYTHLCGRSFQMGVGHYVISHNLGNGSVQITFNGRDSAWTNVPNRFEIGCNNYMMIIDNLVIVREE